ncbi:BMC domain-containing protein [Shuttleworthella sp. MSX8B]|uniref:BMC domain-containing protein n=1 Tax=Shuttleworthella sp. MSX8B TaxID=936574 RepID=UPI002E8E15CB|nr:BMC domain-containing protein [Shuttleworthia sp. MSX8B]
MRTIKRFLIGRAAAGREDRTGSRKMTSYGFIEITGVVAAVDALDIMCKTADVSLASWERKLGGRLVTMIIEGSVEDVAQAISTASANAIKKPVSYGVIANPHEEIRRLVALSASRWNKRLKEAREESPEDAGRDRYLQEV